MKKLLLLLLLLCFGYETAKSQVLISIIFGDKLNSPSTEFGLNAGGNISRLSNLEGTKPVVNYGLGLYFTWKFHDRWQLQPELFFRFPGGGSKIKPYTVSDPVLDSILNNSTIERRSSYFSLPVHIKFRIWNQLRISAAPQLSFMTSNKDMFKSEINDTDELLYKRESMRDLHRFDFGFSAGFSYKLRKGKGVNLEARYYQGVTDTEARWESSVRNSSFCFYVGIPIGAEKKTVENSGN